MRPITHAYGRYLAAAQRLGSLSIRRLTGKLRATAVAARSASSGPTVPIVDHLAAHAAAPVGVGELERFTPLGPAHAAVVSELVYELLDAHQDTWHIAQHLTREPCWEHHLAYLRELQREGRETLARLCMDGTP